MKRFKVLITLFCILSLTGCDSLTTILNSNQLGQAHTHAFSDTWSYDETYHWHSATCEHSDLVIDKSEHVFSDLKIDENAGTNDSQRKYKECIYCSYRKYEGKQEHTHTLAVPVKENEVVATCTNNGSYDLVTYCSECGELISSEHIIVNALGHDWRLTTVVNATHYNGGQRTYVCQRCNEVRTEYISQIPHTSDDLWHYDEEYHWHECTEDGEKLDKNKHDFSDWFTEIEGGITQEGLRKRTCSVCDYIETEIIYPTGTADMQMVAQMNTVLKVNEYVRGTSIYDAFEALFEDGFTVEDFVPIVEGTYFFWDADSNRIVYADKNYNVLYPESMVGVSHNEHQWYSLTQTLPITDIENAKVMVDGIETDVKNIYAEGSVIHYDFAVESAEQLYTIGKELKDAILSAPSGTSTQGDYVIRKDSSVTYLKGDFKLVLTEDIDLMGATFNFCIDGNFEIQGNGHKIKGIVNNKDFIYGLNYSRDNMDYSEFYCSGILGYIRSGTAIFQDVSFDSCHFGYSIGKGGGLVGYANSASLEFDNTQVLNCNMQVYEHSAGGFLADAQSNVTITLKGSNSVKNTNLKVFETVENVSADNRECYGAGYFIGRQTNENLQVYLAEGASFTQTGNTKKFGSKSTPTVPSGRGGYHYWDDAVFANRKLVTE